MPAALPVRKLSKEQFKSDNASVVILTSFYIQLRGFDDLNGEGCHAL
jgi:hypothetical protein